MKERKAKPGCDKCHGTGSICLFTQKEDWGDTAIDMPIYGDCKCLSRWYDPMVAKVRDWRWRYWLWRHSEVIDDIPF
jgi:hypothetical protein